MRLSIFQPHIAMKKSSAFSLLRLCSNSCRPFLCKGSSSSMMASMRTRVKFSRARSSSNINSIYFLSIAQNYIEKKNHTSSLTFSRKFQDKFTASHLKFEEQVITENNKKPDFLFPNSICYHNFEFPAEDLTVLGAKTTCKDRWRQVINEADRVDEKFLFTLQQGISKNQLKEMADEKVKLVVPQSHIDSYPEEYRGSLNTLSGFIEIVKEKQEHMPKHFIVS